MTLYYDGRCVRITSEVFCSSGRIFLIRDPGYVHAVRAPARRRRRVYSSGSAAGVLVASLSNVGDGPMWLTVMVMLAATGVVLASHVLARRRMQELRALYRGNVVCLFRTSDRLVFGQVCRALLRVLEVHNGGRYGG